jgi:isoprenylcysteine carboxyl methyltransferase (ICMT) family protein YpbQ
VTVIETFLLPLAFGALALAIIMTSLWWVVLRTKIRLEDEALHPDACEPSCEQGALAS